MKILLETQQLLWKSSIHEENPASIRKGKVSKWVVKISEKLWISTLRSASRKSVQGLEFVNFPKFSVTPLSPYHPLFPANLPKKITPHTFSAEKTPFPKLFTPIFRSFSLRHHPLQILVLCHGRRKENQFPKDSGHGDIKIYYFPSLRCCSTLLSFPPYLLKNGAHGSAKKSETFRSMADDGGVPWLFGKCVCSVRLRSVAWLRFRGLPEHGFELSVFLRVRNVVWLRFYYV